MKNGEIIDGCSLCVDRILKICHETYPEIDSVATLVSHPKFKQDAWDQKAIMHLGELPKSAKKFTLYKRPRVGLSDKWPDFRDRPYRYCVSSTHLYFILLPTS